MLHRITKKRNSIFLQFKAHAFWTLLSDRMFSIARYNDYRRGGKQLTERTKLDYLQRNSHHGRSVSLDSWVRQSQSKSPEKRIVSHFVHMCLRKEPLVMYPIVSTVNQRSRSLIEEESLATVITKKKM
jgi:hypothetical protein